MAMTKVWDEAWSPREEYGRHLELVAPRALRTGVTVSRRRAARERMLRRRRRALVSFGTVFSIVILAWPGHAFGGETGSGLPADQLSGSSLSSGMVYVVQSGDSLTTIARLIDPAHVSHVRSLLTAELGSTVVVPGEHVLVP